MSKKTASQKKKKKKKTYIQLVEENIKQIAVTLCLGQSDTFQEDNDLKKTGLERAKRKLITIVQKLTFSWKFIQYQLLHFLTNADFNLLALNLLSQSKASVCIK